MNSEYDVIVIGSGIGGLSFASFIAQLAGKRVLVLERHFKLGGYTHTFDRKGFRWDVGIHYIGGMAPGAMPRRLFDLITDCGVEWKKMPDRFDHFDYPDFTFTVHENPRIFCDELIKRFPDEERAIRKYFLDVKKAYKWFSKQITTPMMPSLLAGAVKAIDRFEKLASQTTKQYLDANFSDPKLKAILASQWGDYGVPPARSPFVVHAMVVNHYFGGGFYPIGGSKKIADSIVPVIKAHGGDCLVNQRVTEIIVENGVCKGVKAIDHNQKETIFLAPHVVSDAGAATTFGNLVPPPYRNQKALKQDKDICTCLTLYLGLKAAPTALGFEGENHWIYKGYDHNKTYELASQVIDGKPEFCYLSFPSLKDPEARTHTAEIITFCDYSSFSEWENSSWKHRGQSYEALKEKISASLIDLVEERFPGFKDLVSFQELSTPLTLRDFTGHKQGAIYGEPSTLANFQRKTFDPRTPIKNLYLTGSDVVTSGIMGALMGGVVTASHYLGGFAGFTRLMKAVYSTESKQHRKASTNPATSAASVNATSGASII